MRLAFASLCFLVLAACTAPAATTAPAPATDQRGQPLIAQPAAPGVVDRSCSTDADCAVKNVGSCCGYAPACVNKDSRTFPEQVKAECEREGRMSVCGFEDIDGCQCVDNRCVAGPATSGEAVR